MAIPVTFEQVTHNSPDGAQMGKSATEKVALWGATPAAQPSGSAQAVVAATAAATGASTIETLTENSTQGTPNTTIVAVGAAVTALDVTGSGNAPTEAATNTRMILIDDNFADLADQQSKARVDLAAHKVEIDKLVADVAALIVLSNKLRADLVTLGGIAGA